MEEPQNLSFQECIGKSNIEIHSKVLKNYKDGINGAIKLTGETPIFLDTNVLFKAYSISFEARDGLYDFYKSSKKRIFISHQVQTEFIKNREEIIDRFHDDVTNKLPKNFKEEVLNNLKSFLENNKTVLVDYKDFEKKLSEHAVILNDLSSKLDTLIIKKNKENQNILFDDPFLNIFTKTNLLELSLTDKDRLKKEFDQLADKINIDKLDSEFNKQGLVFPGMGDIRKKPNNPYGDYIIFYEMMKYAVEKSVDIIFLTYDTAKGDWMSLNKSPHIHYLENFYMNTGQMIYILDAQRIFDTTLNLNFKSLISISTDKRVNKSIDLTHKTLKAFMDQNFPNQQDNQESDIRELEIELLRNGYKSIESIENGIIKSEKAFQAYLDDKENGSNRFSKIGNLRIRMELIDENYKLYNSKSGITKNTLYNKYKDKLE